MKSLAMLLILVAMTKAQAAVEYEQFFMNAGGTHLSPSVAIESAMKGTPMYSCVSVEAKTAKSGRSISLHNVKKPKKGE